MSDANEYLTFRKMIIPVIIQIIFWIGTVVCVLAGLVTIVSGIRTTGIVVLYGLLLLIIGPLGVRIYCEILIVIFRMNETLTEINDKLDFKQENHAKANASDTNV